MKLLAKVFAAILVVATGVVGFAYSGLYDVSASSPHNSVASWLLDMASNHSVERRAVGIEVPQLDEMNLVLEGASDFESMCVSCHGAPGEAAGAVGKGLNPPPPNLAVSAAERTAAELFWITKHGIKMTGMPSWGATHDDEMIWPIVAFMAKLPELDSDEYRELLEQASGHGHHADSENMAPHEHDEATAPNVHIHADGSEHVHEEPLAEPVDEADGTQ